MDDLDRTKQLQPRSHHRNRFWIGIQPSVISGLELVRNLLIPSDISVLLVCPTILGNLPWRLDLDSSLLHKHEMDILPAT